MFVLWVIVVISRRYSFYLARIAQFRIIQSNHLRRPIIVFDERSDVRSLGICGVLLVRDDALVDEGWFPNLSAFRLELQQLHLLRRRTNTENFNAITVNFLRFGLPRNERVRTEFRRGDVFHACAPILQRERSRIR